MPASPLLTVFRLAVWRDLRHSVAEQAVQGDPPFLLRAVCEPGALKCLLLHATPAYLTCRSSWPQAHAQAALELHGRELEPGHALVAQISDPSRKKSRSDADANKRELYVANIARSAKEPDLRKLFETYGTLKEIRVPTDDEGSCKGFAFVEFEDEVCPPCSPASLVGLV